MTTITNSHLLWAEAIEIAESCSRIRREAYLRVLEILVHYPDVDNIEKYLFEFDKDPRVPSRSMAYRYFVQAKLNQMTQKEWLQHPKDKSFNLI